MTHGTFDRDDKIRNQIRVVSLYDKIALSRVFVLSTIFNPRHEDYRAIIERLTVSCRLESKF